MSNPEYLYACQRAELLGQPAPSEEEWAATRKSANEVQNEDETMEDAVAQVIFYEFIHYGKNLFEQIFCWIWQNKRSIKPNFCFLINLIWFNCKLPREKNMYVVIVQSLINLEVCIDTAHETTILNRSWACLCVYKSLYKSTKISASLSQFVKASPSFGIDY